MKTTIYLSTGRGVSVITGSDRDWHGEVRLKDHHVQCVAADVNRESLVYCGTLGEGGFVSGDGGSTWAPLEGLRAGNVTSFAVSNSGVAYAGSEPSAIFRSEDAGDTWRELPSLLTLPSSKEWSFPPRPETHHVRSIFPDLAKPNRLHVAIEAGALGTRSHHVCPSSSLRNSAPASIATCRRFGFARSGNIERTWWVSGRGGKLHSFDEGNVNRLGNSRQVSPASSDRKIALGSLP